MIIIIFFVVEGRTFCDKINEEYSEKFLELTMTITENDIEDNDCAKSVTRLSQFSMSSADESIYVINENFSLVDHDSYECIKNIRCLK